MKYTLAITCLLAPSSEALKLSNFSKNLVEKFPTFPSGDNLTKIAAKGLEVGRGALQDGISRIDIDGLNQDVAGAFKGIGDIELTSNNLYSGKFVSDLIMAEYDDFVKNFNANREQIASGIDQGFANLSEGAKQMGLAQVKQEMTLLGPINMDEAGAMAAAGPASEAGQTESDWARDLSQSIGSAEDINAMILEALQNVNQASQTEEGVANLERIITNINLDLSTEADRLGMVDYTLPDPADTAAKVAAFLTKVTDLELSGNGSLNGNGQAIKDTLEQVASSAENAVKHALGHLGVMDTPEEIKKSLEEARGMINSEDAAGMVAEVSGALKSEADVDWSAAEILEFANDTIDTAEALIVNPGVADAVVGLQEEV